MSLRNDANSGRFWDRFEGVLLEAVRCRFFATAMGIANRRFREFEREHGPFLHAVQSHHLPCALQLLTRLKKSLEALVSFEPESNDVKLVSVRDPLKPAFAIVAKFEDEIVTRLDMAVEKGDEGVAKEAVTSAKEVAKDLVRMAKKHFVGLPTQLEKDVAACLVEELKEEPRFIVCVSIDLAHYGRHTRILDSYIEAHGVFALNKRIQSGIQAALESGNLAADSYLKIDTGDGALVFFLTTSAGAEAATVESAVRFSQRFFAAFEETYKKIEVENQLHFRVGICSGVVEVSQVRIRGCHFAQCRVGGVVIGTSVRLQSAARTGEIVVCKRTWGRLPDGLKTAFSPEESVFGKAHEKNPIPAHRLTCVRSRPEEGKSGEVWS